MVLSLPFRANCPIRADLFRQLFRGHFDRRSDLQLVTRYSGYQVQGLYGPNDQLLLAEFNLAGVHAGKQTLAQTAGLAIDFHFLADRADDFHLLWTNAVTSTVRVYYQVSLDGGETWRDSAIALAENNNVSHVLAAVDPHGGLYAAWRTSSYGIDLIHWTKQDGWGPAIPVTGT